MFRDLPIILFDLETTGLDQQKDRIVEYAFASPDGSWQMTGLVDPGIPIPKEATEVHGISDEDVADAPRFEEVAEEIAETIEGAVLAGFNSRQFDVPFLAIALHRAGLQSEAKGVLEAPEIDLYRVWKALEPRSLEGAIRRFAPFEENAYSGLHRAEFDVAVLPDVFQGMVKTFGEQDSDRWLELSAPKHEVDRDGRFRRLEDGTVVFDFGKHKGREVTAETAGRRGYLEWMLGGDFGPEVKMLVRRVLKGEKL